MPWWEGTPHRLLQQQKHPLHLLLHLRLPHPLHLRRLPWPLLPHLLLWPLLPHLWLHTHPHLLQHLWPLCPPKQHQRQFLRQPLLPNLQFRLPLHLHLHLPSRWLLERCSRRWFAA